MYIISFTFYNNCVSLEFKMTKVTQVICPNVLNALGFPFSQITVVF